MEQMFYFSGPRQRAPALRRPEASRVHLLRPRRAEEARRAQVLLGFQHSILLISERFIWVQI